MLIDDDLRLTKTSVGPMDNNAYLLTVGDDQLGRTGNSFLPLT